MELTPMEKITIESYDKAAGFRKQSCTTKFFWQDMFERLKEYLPTGNVIDVGCGTGSDARMFIPIGYDYLGIDLSVPLLDVAKEVAPEADFRLMNLYNLASEIESGFKDDEFDLVWAACSLIHVPKARIDDALTGIKRVLKPKGFGFIAMREGDGEQMVSDSQGSRFFSLYSLPQFANILARNNFYVLDQSRDERGANKFSSGFLCYHVRNGK
ncbi:class I SAM-dependent methyltransferase [Candidatus Woesearchaeota archaeon]|nr:class I SAM-dependent methyltransferase [Candidatus Woesearchaeota archaeon]